MSLPPVPSKVTKCEQLETDCQPPAAINWLMLTYVSNRVNSSRVPDTERILSTAHWCGSLEAQHLIGITCVGFPSPLVAIGVTTGQLRYSDIVCFTGCCRRKGRERSHRTSRTNGKTTFNKRNDIIVRHWGEVCVGRQHRKGEPRGATILQSASHAVISPSVFVLAK